MNRFILFIVISFLSFTANANLSCSSLFLDTSMFSENKLLLSERQLDTIKHHEITKFANAVGSDKIAFTSMFFIGNIESTLYKGEFFQAQFVRQILTKLFPAAIFTSDDMIIPSSYKKVKIVLAELAERFSGQSNIIQKLTSAGLILPMHLTKAANSSRISIQRSVARTTLSLPQNRKIISMYVRSYDTLTDNEARSAGTQFFPLFAAIQRAFPMDIVILSFGNKTKRMTFESSGAPRAFAWQDRQSLSVVMGGKSVLTPLTLIENDTIGNMLNIHAASDLAVVVGPVNFIEPLRVDTPTLFIDKNYSETRNSNYGSFDNDIIDELFAFAEPTNLIRRVQIKRLSENYSDISRQLQDLSTARTTDYDMSQAAFPIFLDALKKHLDYQINNYNNEDYRRYGL